MTESRSHKKGKTGAKKEVSISGGRRLDSIRGNTAIEVERSGTTQGINKALSRLTTQKNKSKLLKVHQNDMEKAVDLAKKKDMNVTVSNLGGTKRKGTK
jgi:hypothetical protein